MRHFSLFAAIVFFAASASAADFVVVNKMPKAFVVANKCKCSICENCQCIDCTCPAGTKIPTKPAKTQDVIVVPTVVKTVATTRAAVSHTHSCSNGHALVTWDHASNPGHNCPVCGRMVTVQDPPGRRVTVFQRVVVPAEVHTAATPPVAAPVAYPPSLVRYTAATSACANGQCSTISRRR